MAAKPMTYDDDAPELTDAELAEFRPARTALSKAQFDKVSSVRRGRPKAADPKMPVTIRLDRDVVEAFKATGKGWQTRINDTLASAVNGTRRAVHGRAPAPHGPDPAADPVEDAEAKGAEARGARKRPGRAGPAGTLA